jgi:hypothetical protein
MKLPLPAAPVVGRIATKPFFRDPRQHSGGIQPADGWSTVHGAMKCPWSRGPGSARKPPVANSDEVGGASTRRKGWSWGSQARGWRARLDAETALAAGGIQQGAARPLWQAGVVVQHTSCGPFVSHTSQPNFAWVKRLTPWQLTVTGSATFFLCSLGDKTHPVGPSETHIRASASK